MFITNSFYLDGDYFFDYMSSGNNSNYYDPIRESAYQYDTNLPGQNVADTERTQTDRLADYLKNVNNKSKLSKKGIRFTDFSSLSELEKEMRLLSVLGVS